MNKKNKGLTAQQDLKKTITEQRKSIQQLKSKLEFKNKDVIVLTGFLASAKEQIEQLQSPSEKEQNISDQLPGLVQKELDKLIPTDDEIDDLVKEPIGNYPIEGEEERKAVEWVKRQRVIGMIAIIELIQKKSASLTKKSVTS